MVDLVEGVFDERGCDGEVGFSERAAGFECFGADGRRAEVDFAEDVILFHVSTLVGLWGFWVVGF